MSSRIDSPLTVLALDTATEHCSVALSVQGAISSQAVATARGHADMILGMIQQLIANAGIALHQLDAIAFGRGPGAFTGVRLAVGVTQGLAFALDKPVLPVSNLAAVAQQALAELATGEQVLVCMDARMGEVYTASFIKAEHSLVLAGEEQVCAPERVPMLTTTLGLGTGFAAYPQLAERFSFMPQRHALPSAVEILQLALADHVAGKSMAAEQAMPVYLRDQVVQVKS